MHKNKRDGLEAEKKAGLLMGLDQVPGSGCGIILKGDLVNEQWLVEHKNTSTGELRFLRSWWEKAKDEAGRMNKPFWAVSFSFTTRPEDYEGSLNFVIVDHLASVLLPELEMSGDVEMTYKTTIKQGFDFKLGFLETLFTGEYYRLRINTASSVPGLHVPLDLMVIRIEDFRKLIAETNGISDTI